MSKYFLILISSIAIISSTYASDLKTHRQEARDLCEVYNPDNWIEFFKSNDHTITGIYKEIGKRINKIVKTEDFRNIYQDVYGKYQPDVYTYTKNHVSKLIGEDWECDYYRNFYFPRKEIVLNIEEVDRIIDPLLKQNEIIITVDKEGNLYVNSDELKIPDIQSIKNSILAQPDNKSAAIVIYTDSDAPHQRFVTVLSALNSLGIKKISIATQ